MEMDQMKRMQQMAPPVINQPYGVDPRVGGLRGDPGMQEGSLRGGLRDRSRSPEPGYASRSVHVEVAELKDKLEQTQTELRRTQAELRLNQGDYERSHVELEQMQEKVIYSYFLICSSYDLTNTKSNFHICLISTVLLSNGFNISLTLSNNQFSEFRILNIYNEILFTCLINNRARHSAIHILKSHNLL